MLVAQREPVGLIAPSMSLMYVYKTQLDEALTERRYEVVGHQVVRLTNQVPTIATSVFFDLDTRPNERNHP